MQLTILNAEVIEMIKMSDNPELIAKWKAIWKDRCTSSMSTADHCSAHGIAKSTYNKWAHYFREMEHPQEVKKKKKEVFCPVVLSGPKDVKIKINGIAMEFSEDLNEDALNKIVRACRGL